MGRTSYARERLVDAMVNLMWERSYSSLTIDVICDTAQVKKGSFYYFFKSKLELAIVTFDHIWTNYLPLLDTIYSPSRPPLERLAIQMQQAYTKTKEIADEYGRVLGCPYFNVGAEISTIEPELIQKVNDLLALYQGYMESAVIQAQANGDIDDINAKEAARIIFNLFEGMLTQARMKNDPELLKDLPIATARILGLKNLPEVDAQPILAPVYDAMKASLLKTTARQAEPV